MPENPLVTVFTRSHTYHHHFMHTTLNSQRAGYQEEFTLLDPSGPATPVIHLVSCINLAQNYVQLLTPLLSPYLNTDSLFIHGFPSFIQQSSSEQPSAHSLRASCLTQMPLDPYSRIPWT